MTPRSLWSTSHSLVVALVVCVLLLSGVTRRCAGAEDPVSLSAVDQSMEGEILKAIGNVKVSYQDVSITCDEMEYNRLTLDLVARGSVVVDQGPHRFTADELHYNLRTKTGIFFNGTGALPPSYHFTGAEVEKLDETHYRLSDATFTTCQPGGRPPWDFHVRKALIEDGGYGKFRSTSMRVKGLPVFYAPYMVWPIKRERAAGLLVPAIGHSARRGTYVGNALFIPLGRSYDTTLYLDAYSKGYYGVGSEWRWMPVVGGEGELTAYTIRDPVTDTWEWKINGKHTQEDLLGFRLLAEVEDLSNIEFFREFERSFDQNTRRYLYSYLYLTRSWGPYALNLRSDRRTTFYSTSEIELMQIPEIELRVRPNRIGKSDFYWNLVSSLNYFNVDKGENQAADYGRADLYPNLSYTLPGPPWLSVTPRLGARGTLYGKRTLPDRSYEDERIDRTYLTAGVDIVGPSFSRVFNQQIGPFTRFKHLIEPRLEYTYLSDPGDLSQIPLFDEVDSTPVTNHVRVTLANRFLARSRKGVSAQELGSFEAYQDYSFSEPLNTGSGGLTSQRGPLGLALRITPVPGMSFDARASYDTLFHNLRSTSLAIAGYRSGFATNLTWYESYAPTTGETTSSQARISFGLRKPKFPLKLDLHVSYDLERSKTQQQRALLHYEGSCWGITVEYRDLELSEYPSRDYRLLISLKGVGHLPEVKGSLNTLGSN